MPKINTFRRRVVPSGSVGAAPRSTRAAITRGELVGEALGELGRFFQGYGREMKEAEDAEAVVNAVDASNEADLQRKQRQLESLPTIPGVDTNTQQSSHGTGLGSELSSPGRHSFNVFQ